MLSVSHLYNFLPLFFAHTGADIDGDNDKQATEGSFPE